jgi:hypothetical protein
MMTSIRVPPREDCRSQQAGRSAPSGGGWLEADSGFVGLGGVAMCPRHQVGPASCSAPTGVRAWPRNATHGHVSRPGSRIAGLPVVPSLHLRAPDRRFGPSAVRCARAIHVGVCGARRGAGGERSGLRADDKQRRWFHGRPAGAARRAAVVGREWRVGDPAGRGIERGCARSFAVCRRRRSELDRSIGSVGGTCGAAWPSAEGHRAAPPLPPAGVICRDTAAGAAVCAHRR